MSDDLSETTTLMPDQAAIVWDPEDGFTARLPNLHDDTPVPGEIVLLMTLLMRINNEQSFVDDQIAWMDERVKSLEEDEGARD